MKIKKKILIVEDDSFTIKLYTRLLSDEGFEVISTPAANEACGLAKREKPNLIIMDLMLTDGNGFEVIKQIRKETSLKKIPIITLSNLGQETDIDEALKKGSNKYFVKSNTRFEEVVKAVKELI
ncbi:MAG: Response regulator receiver protein [Candidatus Magasanikbacteria bacterium GW2011_GWC2_37_14]|uniref:Response regulator receiver protein n=1 Tax=Candidatus Magasanikbacteria bacterium GW2011_GWC2_37_14 TaxID=1619046 RepID=A0A0G0IT87_9BACT|nr:MAG: Response regulator receiver protein [Candidatus Magasanikbacteria bacterium GW2011_GWC2_37_14]